jgi:HK97 family phage portal protein
MSWFRKKTYEPQQTLLEPIAIKDGAMILEIVSEKSFDWSHYERTLNESNIWSDEHRMAPDARLMLSIYAKESLIRMGIDAIARQFMGAKLQSKDARLLALLANPNSNESSAEFHFGNIVMLETTGNLFLYHDNSMIVRLPTDKITAKYDNSGAIVEYTVNAQRTAIAIQPENVLHIKLPNPMSARVGLSPLSSLPAFILLDKYACELSISYYLRGGNLAGVLETEVEDSMTLNRLKLSLEQGNGSRRNSFRDKILPKGVKWAGTAQGLASSLILENSRHAQRRILAVLGVPPVMVGDTDSVNYANAIEQRASFWRETIMPLQTLYCAGLSKLGAEITIDNSKVEELSQFNIRLEQDAKLADILSINERRERLGFLPTTDAAIGVKPTPAGAKSMLESSVPEQRKLDYKTLGWYEAPDRGFDAVKLFLERVLQEYLDGNDNATMVDGFAKEFSPFFAESIRAEMAEAWDTASSSTFQNTDGKAAKIIEEMRNSQLNIAKSIIETRGVQAFVGFSETMTKRIDTQIIAGVDAGRSLQEIRLNLKKTFGEEYKGQMRTIANTEFRTAMSLVNEQFGEALQSVAKVMTKRWISMDDNFVRTDHQSLHGKQLTGSADTIKNMSFGQFIDGNPTLRYPRDTSAGAAQVINCRCVLLWEVEEYA